jgi:hypothetical protein
VTGPTLDDHLGRFVDAAMTGDLSAARAAFVDVQAYDLRAVGLAAHVWVARELQAPLTSPGGELDRDKIQHRPSRDPRLHRDLSPHAETAGGAA